MWIDRLANKMRRIAIPSLMKYIVLGMGAVFILDLLTRGTLSSLLFFSREAILSGQLWRLVTFIFLPINTSMIFIIFTLYFYWMIGEAMEREWGEAKFNLFYITGIVGTIIAGFITGFATNHFLNLSLFIAFAILFPNFELLLFFALPVKVKWLAYIDAAYFAYLLIVSNWPQRVALLVAIANLILFFWHDAQNQIANYRRRKQWQNQYRNRR